MEQKFITKFAETEQEKLKAYSLRYTDMLQEYQPNLVLENGLDYTEYDDYAKQVICIDTETNEVVGVYRVITSDDLPKAKPFVCEDEFNITDLKNTGEGIAELSRAVIKREYRNSTVLMHLLRFIITYLKDSGYRYIIGEASFFGTDKTKYVKEFSYLSNNYSVLDYDITANEDCQLDYLKNEELDLQAIKRSLPPLIRAYLSFGAKVSKETYTDWDFGSVDIFILLDMQNYNEAYIKRFLKL
ncbi:MAG: GNAT family N-acetyltransferase [Clostridia bacterium]|nr:GNAT family N-acetyltransferase [Clostridia bacterium]